MEGIRVVNVDRLNYAASDTATATVEASDRYERVVADINDRTLVGSVLASARPDAVLHLAAETHVDRSIDSADEFLRSNVLGTVELLRTCADYRDSLAPDAAESFVFHHVSTDEVFGSLGDSGRFDAMSRYDPRSPYAASKAAAPGRQHSVWR